MSFVDDAAQAPVTTVFA